MERSVYIINFVVSLCVCLVHVCQCFHKLYQAFNRNTYCFLCFEPVNGVMGGDGSCVSSFIWLLSQANGLIGLLGLVFSFIWMCTLGFGKYGRLKGCYHSYFDSIQIIFSDPFWCIWLTITIHLFYLNVLMLTSKAEAIVFIFKQLSRRMYLFCHILTMLYNKNLFHFMKLTEEEGIL